MATVSWNSGVSGTWETASDWSTGDVPGSNDIVSISAGGTYTVTVAAAASAYSLTIGNVSASLDLAANLTLSGGLSDAQSLIDISAGTLAVTGGPATFGVNYDAQGATVDGPGTFSTAAGVLTTIDNGLNNASYYSVSLILGGGVTWSNSGTVADTGLIQIGDGNGETAKIVNEAGGVFQFDGPIAGIYDNTNASGSFSNAGTIDNGVNTGFSPALTNTSTGVVDLQGGTLNLETSSIIGGTVTGGGVLQFSGGNSTITALTTGNLLVSGATLTLAEKTTITGAVSETSGAIAVSAGGPASETLAAGFADSQGQVSVATGDTLSISGGSVTFGVNYDAQGATVDGPGTFSTAAGVLTTIDNGLNNASYYSVSLILGGGVTWSNSGTVADTGLIQIGNGNGETAKIVNEASGVFQFEGPIGGIYDNTNASGSFSNAGTIDNGVNTGFSLALTNTSTGVVDLQGGTLNLETNSIIGGTVTGGGVLQFSGGNSTITALTTGNLLVSGATLTLAEKTTITGAVSETSGAIAVSAGGPASETLAAGLADSQGQVSVAAGETLKLTGGTVTFGVNSDTQGASVNGPGTLATAAGVLTTIDNGYNNASFYNVALILGGGVTWSNSGTVADTGLIQIGDGNGETAKIVNAAGGVFELEGPIGGIIDNTNASGVFSNAGTLIEAAGNGVTTALWADVTNTGVIDAQSGILDLQGGGSIGGTIEAGGGTVQFGAGVFTLTGAIGGNVLATGGAVTIDTAKTITAGITNAGATMLIGGNTVMSGVILDQSGLLEIAGDTLKAKAVTIDGGATLSGYGTIGAASIDNGLVLAENGALSLGAGASGTGVAAIAGGATLTLLGSSDIATISFQGGGAETLALAAPSAITGTISGFGATDAIDLLKTVATKLAFANGTLTVSGASGTIASLDFSGNYATANFALQSDGNDGTDIVFKQVNAVSPHALAEDFNFAAGWAVEGGHGDGAYGSTPERDVVTSMPHIDDIPAIATIAIHHGMFR